jgi:UDP-glucose 4-epimerase
VEALAGGSESKKFNVGTGHGFSVKEVLNAVEKVTGKKVPCVTGPRRDGDPPMLVADSTRLQRELGWKPEYSDLNRIVETAWAWANRNGLVG